MGTWGCRPRENDMSADGLDCVMDRAVSFVAKAICSPKGPEARVLWGRSLDTSQARWEKIGVVEGMLGLGCAMPHSVLRVCLRWLKQLQKDEKWLSTWFHAKQIGRVVAAYATLFEGILQAGKERRVTRKLRLPPLRELGWRNWPLPAKRGARTAFGAHYEAFRRELVAIQRTRYRITSRLLGVAGS